jgi:hypothetical protein
MFDQERSSECEKEIMEYIDESTPHAYWLARSFVLLADLYASQGRNAEAKQYLVSLQSNYSTDDDIKTLIEERLNNLYMVAESLVIENNGRLTALVVPDYELANAEGVALDNLQEIMDENLKQLNTMVASYEKVANIVIHREEFVKTPKRSIKRYLYSAERLNLN